MKSMSLLGLACLGVGVMAAPAQAQSLRDIQFDGRSDLRATASVTIPLGARRDSSEAKPRFDFAMESAIRGADNSGTPFRFDHNERERVMRLSALSLTLEQNPRLTLNGQSLATFGLRLTADEEDDEGGGLSTGDGILIGLGVLGALTLAGSLELADEFEDLGDPD